MSRSKTANYFLNSPFQSDKTPFYFAENGVLLYLICRGLQCDYLFSLCHAYFELDNIRKTIQQFLKKNLSLNNNFVSLWHQM